MERVLFAMLLLSFLLVEFAFFGYMKSNNPWYVLSLSFSTAALCAVGYLLYDIASGRTSGIKKDYYFYFTDNRPFGEGLLGLLPAAKRK